MSNVRSEFYSSLAALAAYARFQLGNTNLDVNVSALTASSQDNGPGMVSAQARAFATLYTTVVAQFNDRTIEGGMNTGLSVAVLKDDAGNLTVAFRGVDKWALGDQSDFPTGADIFGAGAGYDQIVAMANWWLRESAPNDQSVPQYRLTTYAPSEVPGDAVVLRSDAESAYVLEAADRVLGSGGALCIALASDPDLRVDVTGHSLGGHLAMAFSSLFSAQTGQVTVFNAPGFLDNFVNEAFFSKLGGAVPTGAAIDNVAADEALIDSNPFNWIAGMNSRPGVPTDIAIENQSDPSEPVPFDPGNHSMAALTDSLAVYGLLADLSPGLSTDEYKVILNQVVWNSAASYERIVDTLENLFGINNTYLPVGNTEREALYQAIYGDGNGVGGLVNNPTYQAYQQATLQITAGSTDAATLISEIQNSSGSSRLAYSYALTRLNTFVATDPSDGVLTRNFRRAATRLVR